MSKTRLKTALRTAGAVALSGLVLTGCAGSARPGVAVEVGDETISTSTVDSASAHLCTALSDQFKGDGTVVPMGFIRQGVVQLLTLSSTAQQIADEYGVEPGAAYQRELASRRRSAEAFPEEVREDYVEVMSANALATDVLTQVGRAEAGRGGLRGPDRRPGHPGRHRRLHLVARPERRRGRPALRRGDGRRHAHPGRHQPVGGRRRGRQGRSGDRARRHLRQHAARDPPLRLSRVGRGGTSPARRGRRSSSSSR